MIIVCAEMNDSSGTHDFMNGTPKLHAYRKPLLGGSVGTKLALHHCVLSGAACHPKSRGSTGNLVPLDND